MMQNLEADTLAEPRTQPMTPHQFRILRRSQDTHDTFTLELEPTKRNGGFTFAPGQFNMLYIFGVGEVPISISGDPGDHQKLIHTTRAVGSVTRALSRMKADSVVGVRGPFGTHWPVEEAVGSDVVIVAGGIGLAPLRPAIYHVLAHREKYGRVAILYGTRTPNDILYKRELERWRSRFDLEVNITVDRAMEGWHGNVGVVTTLIPKAHFDPPNTTAMVVGPEVMMRFTVSDLHKRGIPYESIYVSMERNMKCGIGLCGHCQYGPTFICKDGPVYPFSVIKELFTKREI